MTKPHHLQFAIAIRWQQHLQRSGVVVQAGKISWELLLAHHFTNHQVRAGPNGHIGFLRVMKNAR